MTRNKSNTERLNVVHDTVLYNIGLSGNDQNITLQKYKKYDNIPFHQTLVTERKEKSTFIYLHCNVYDSL